MRTAEVVVIGGGCVGTSVLYHLAALGCPDAVLLEGTSLGAGSTSKSAGGIRMQHADATNSELSLRSLGEFSRFEELTGVAIDFHQVGYLFLLATEQEQQTFLHAAQAQRHLGIPTELLDVGAVAEMVPQLHTDDLVGASFCPWDGYAAPEAVVQGYATAARRLGAKVHIGAEVVEILTDAQGVCGVRTAAETIATRSVVLAAGVASRELAAGVGLDLPVVGEPRTIFYSGDGLGVPVGAPLVVDFATGFYFHREGAGLVFAGRESDPAELSGPATHRLPAIVDASIESSWWGYYDTSPDHNALVGEAPLPGLHYATGFSGHGFMQSPAVGEHVAESVLGVAHTMDLSGLRADRFGTGSSPYTFVI